jgi:hypothetical protein
LVRAGRNSRHSLDHLVGAREQRRRHVQAERPGSFQVDHQLEYRRLLHRKVGGLLAFEYPIDIARRNVGGETLLVVTTARDLALRRAMLPERRTGATLGDMQLRSDLLNAGTTTRGA